MRKWSERAMQDFAMIEPGDRILVAISGGLDSLVLFHLLTGPMVHVTKDFHLEFAHVVTGFPGSDPDPVSKWVEERGRKLHVLNSGINDDFKDVKKSLCFFCSRRRRKVLLETAQELGCTKVATGHHRDDAVESFLMNMVQYREISTSMPVQPMFDGLFTFIRPMYYLSDHLVKRFAAEREFTSLESPCPMENRSKRDSMRKMMAAMREEFPDFDKNIFSSMFRVVDKYLPDPPDGKNPPELPDDV